jgi:hypothetical protein
MIETGPILTVKNEHNTAYLSEIRGQIRLGNGNCAQKLVTEVGNAICGDCCDLQHQPRDTFSISNIFYGLFVEV